MQSIEINTAQNVPINYELADLRHRIFAYLIDILCIGSILVVLLLIIDNLHLQNGKLLAEIISFIVLGFYAIVSEIIGNGQSIGKKIMGIKVIKASGKQIEFYDYFCRWSTRLIDIYLSLGSLAALFIIFKPKGQRLGDILAGTCIVKTQNSQFFSLKEIEQLNLKFNENTSLKYPLVKNLKESDVLLIKNVLYRLKNYPNQAHEAALRQLSEKLKTILEIQEIPDDREKFLSQVISDYIIQTR